MSRCAVQFAACIFAVSLCGPSVDSAAAQDAQWDLEPHRIRAIIAASATGRWGEQLADELAMYVGDRVEAAIGAAWRLEIETATGPLRHQLLNDLDSFTDDDLTSLPTDGNKLLLLSIRQTPVGFEMAGRDYDRYVQRWGPVIRRECRQQSALPEQLFALVWHTIAPLARLELDADDEHRVVLRLRGAGLPRPSDDARSIHPGDVLLPILRQTTREGEVIDGGIQVVPWTYVEATDVDDEQNVGHIHSGTRRPLGVRRRGRVDQVALALRTEPGDTVVRFRSRTRTEKPLVGYEVFVQNAGETTTRLIGVSDRLGQVVVPPGDSAVQLITVRHGAEPLARLPVVPGVERQIDVPLPDDDARLAAEVSLTALREQLVDLVARRNILMARTRMRIEQHDFAQAQQLLQLLDGLPGRAHFNQALAREARTHRSDDPQVQRMIDRLFATTQSIVAQYLDTRPISQLHDELREARAGQESTAESREPEAQDS